jgi:hypothetical protein
MPNEQTSGVIDLILAIAALATLVTLVRSWRSFWDDTFTSSDRRLAIQIAIFLIPPVVVLLHELGHAAAVVGAGARVTSFRWGLFEGSVGFVGRVSPGELWWIALSGNLVSFAAGLLLVGLALAMTGWRRPLRYTLLAGGLFELIFSLIGYPLLSLSSRFGDWIVIYDLDRTPGLSGATAVVHALVLAGLWRWWQARGRATMFAIGAGVEDRLAELRRQLERAPGDLECRLRLAAFYLERGEAGLARGVLDEGVAAGPPGPGTARLHLARARLALFERRWNDCVVAARAGLEAGGDEDMVQRLWANLALALGQMDRPDHALAAFGHLRPPVVDDARVRYGRGLVRMAAGDQGGGRADLEAVVQALPEGHLLRRWAEARLAGRELERPDDSHLPAYARGGGPPPAPIAGV